MVVTKDSALSQDNIQLSRRHDKKQTFALLSSIQNRLRMRNNHTTTHSRHKSRRKSIFTNMIVGCCSLSLLLLAVVAFLVIMAIDSQTTLLIGAGGGVEAFAFRQATTTSTVRWHREIVLSGFASSSSSSSPSSGWLNRINSSSTRSRSLQTTRRSVSSSRLFSSQADDADDDVYTTDEVSEMHDLVLSLSLEPTDHERRIKLRDIFHEKLDSGNERFCRLFDTILTEVGDEVQMEARKRLFEQQEQEAAASAAAAAAVDGEEVQPVEDIETSQDNDKISSSYDQNSEDEEVTLPPPREKSPDELQLWALVDMMVQSKTIVKKVSGELGSKGSFQ